MDGIIVAGREVLHHHREEALAQARLHYRRPVLG
jgi:hypothetical protein